ncbi:hypothetical protein NCCP1664_21470 [Zafaria cholistanensis]|uniref:Uncharacterized protein n=1 Tax=Zafaria cholistanensis TaxID=1682741 RepID=A0A5A7NU25_9MICC|nr:hypothetical protein NCCP1664_21470 [Zafaria cholistanensis]
MVRRNAVAADGMARHHGAPGNRTAITGLILIGLCGAFLAIGLGGRDAFGSLWFGMMVGLGMFVFGLVRSAGGIKPPGGFGRPPGDTGRE